MKNKIVICLVSLILPSLATANESKLTLKCIAKVIQAVNKHHKLAEGSVYAFKTLYSGQLASTALVGHSDETDPTDYLVTVEHSHTKDCKVAAIVYADDASDVYEYSLEEQEIVGKAEKLEELELTKTALELLYKLPASDYDNRTLCIVGNKVTGIVPMTHWAANDRKIATGTVTNFPAKIEATGPEIKLTSKKPQLVSGTEGNGIYKSTGKVNRTTADICLFESKAVLENVGSN